MNYFTDEHAVIAPIPFVKLSKAKFYAAKALLTAIVSKKNLADGQIVIDDIVEAINLLDDGLIGESK